MAHLAFLHQSTQKRRELILTGSIYKTLLLLSVPTLMMGLVQSLIPLADGLFINNIAGTVVASAVTYSGPIVNMLVTVAQGLSVAAMAIIGQMNGRGEYVRVKHIATQIMVCSFILGCVMAPLLVLFSFPISKNVDPQISQTVFTYISLYALVLPFSFVESIYNAIKNATGKPEATFIRMILMLVIKVIGNFIFIMWLRLGVVGCVLSSLFANIIICGWMFYELFFKQGEDKLELTGFKFDWGILKQLFRLGVPSMITSLMVNLGFFLINNESQKYGAAVLTGQGIAGNITQVCFNLPSAFGAAVTTMVSMNVGAGMSKRAKKCCNTGTLFSVATAMLIISIVVPLGPYLTVLFTRDPAVLDIANVSLRLYTFSVIGFGICMVQQGAFIGLGRTKLPLVAGILRIWFLRYIFILATERYLGAYSVFWGNLFSNSFTAVITTVLILRIRWVSVIPAENKEPTAAAEK